MSHQRKGSHANADHMQVQKHMVVSHIEMKFMIRLKGIRLERFSSSIVNNLTLMFSSIVAVNILNLRITEINSWLTERD